MSILFLEPHIERQPCRASSNSLSLERPGRGAGECREHRRAPTDPVTTGKLLARRTVVYRRHHEGFPHGRGTDIRWESSIFQESRRLLFSSPIENRFSTLRQKIRSNGPVTSYGSRVRLSR